MSKQLNSPWPLRLQAANKQYGEWSTKFKCDTLENYYEGFQWKSRNAYQVAGYNPYTINLFYSTIKIKLANFLFQRPSFLISPKPGSSDWSLDTAVKSALTKQDTLNTILQNPNLNFVKHCKLAALDSFFRFGLMEVGYSSDWRNPQKEGPLLKSWSDTQISEEKDKVLEDNEVPINEQFYVKRIKPKRFRVASGETTDLHDTEWCGYYEYFYTNILHKTRGIKWPKDAIDGNTYSGEYVSQGMLDSMDSGDGKAYGSLGLINSGAVSKVWHLFDLVSKKRCLYLDDYWEEPLWEDSLERLPLLDLRWDLRTTGFYPIPPTFQWLSPQDEINEAREQTRSYRRRYTRRFQVVKGGCSEEEKEKFAAGPDGTIVEVNTANAITPIENPAISSTVMEALIVAKDDFILISGSSAEVTKSDRETATKSTIEDQRAKIRESAEQLDFSNFMCLVAREVLSQAQEKMSIGLWAKLSQDPGQDIMQDMQISGPLYKYITNQDIADGYDYEIEIDVQNATPAAMAQQEQNFAKFLTYTTQFPMIMLSPVLIRKAALVCNFRDEQVIQQMQQAAVLQMAMKAQDAANSQGMTVDEAESKITPGQGTREKQMQVPDGQQIQNQLNEQIM